MLKTDKAKRFKLSILAMVLATLPLGAQAAGLGRLTVTSALGQPLRAEIEVTANRDEVNSLSARLASPEAFKNAGIEFTPALSGIRFSLDKRPDGKLFVVASSDRPFNEPFVDMLVEMNWASGRLVREYTFLLDPPEVLKRAGAPAPVAVPEVAREPAPRPAPAMAPAPEPAPATQAPAAPAAAPVPAAPAPQRAAPAAIVKPSAEVTTRQVVKGDTLGKIASEVKPAGVNLDQMLAALFLSNKDVFDGGNMNRLRAGKILTIPGSEAAAAVEPAEARKMVVAQAADFNAYRRKLAAATAAAPAPEEAPKQSVSGKIAPKVEEKAPPAAAGKDKLEVSPTEAGKGAASRLGAMEEDLIARDKELREAQGRIAALEKNLAELRKLSEMKGATKPVAPEKSAPALAVPAAPVEPLKPIEPPKPVEPPTPAEPPKAVEPPKPAPAPAEPPPPPPSFIEENPAIVFGGGAIVALLLGYLGYNAWRRKRQAAEAESPVEAEVSSVFGSSGGQTVDTGEAPPTDFSVQAGDTAADEGVDPVAEADVYIAYGRDTQAEEILLEALQIDPTRTAIHVKLLEIYAARKDIASFESVARELYGLTGGSGPDWERAQLLGRSIDPANPLYGGGSPAPVSQALDMTATVVTTAAGLQAAQAVAAEAAEPPAPAEEAPASLDFDLDVGAAPAAAPEQTEEATSLDFDLGSAPEAETPAAAEAPATLDFELDMPATEPEAAPAEQQPAAPAADANAMDFDFDLSEPAAPAAAAPAMEEPALPVEAPPVEEPVPAVEPAAADGLAALDLPPVEEPAVAAAEPAAPAFDFGSISLDLDKPSAAAMPEAEPLAPEVAVPAEPEPSALLDDPEVATKLELAQAYEEMGDKEGARELLNEVLNEGSAAQQEAARQRLAALA